MPTFEDVHSEGSVIFQYNQTFLAHLSLLRVSFWDTAMSVVRVDVRDVRDVRNVRPSTF